MNSNMGAIPLSTDILEKANIGLWAFELDEGKEPRMYVDDVMLGLIGLSEQTTPEKTYHAWYDHIDPDHYKEVAESVEKMTAGIHAEVQYPWHHPDGHVMIVRCGGVRNFAYTQGIRIEGTHRDVTEVVHVEKQKETLLDGLAREYHTVWLMDGFGDHKVHLYRSTGKTTVQSAVKLGLDEPCYDTSVVKYVMKTVHEDDRERVLEATKFETIERETPDVGTYVVTYKRYNDQGKVDYHQICFAKAVSPDGGTNYIMAYRDADKTMREQLKRQEQIDQYNKIINALAADYSSVYVVNLADSSLYVAKMSGRITGMFGDTFKKSDYTKAYNTYVDSAVCEDEKEEMREILSVDYIREHLKGVSSFVKYYINNNGEYTEMKAVKTDDDDEVVLGFGVKDAEIRAQLAMTEEMKRNNSLVNILSDDYLSVFSLNYETDKYTVISKENSQSVAQSHSSTAEAEAAISDYISKYVHPDDRKMLTEAIAYDNIKERLAHANRYRVTFRTSYGSKGYKYLDFVAGKEGDPDSPVTSVAMGFQDVDERVRKEKEYQEKLEDALSKAQAANIAKTAFLNSMSHDIRTPMNAITGFTSMAIKHIGDEEKVLDYLEKTQKAGNMLLSLINGVLEVSRIEAGQATLDEQPGDVYLSFETIQSTMQELAATKDIRLTFAFGRIKDRYVYADFVRCVRIFVNIITNGIKYTNEGGYVRVTCEQVGEAKDGIATYRYTFEDNGIGMTEEFQEHIYEQFAREKTSTVSGIQGTGLGMSVVKSFVDLLGGDITVKSKLGEGTTFTVTLPFRMQERKQYTDPVSGRVMSREYDENNKEMISFSGKKVLLVEDNEMNREISTEILAEEGMIVDTAEDGTVAVGMLREKGPGYYDFILMDIQMPVMNGYEATKAIREMFPDSHIPIIALSANAFAEDRRKSIEAGMDDHVAKPIDVLVLKKTLAKYL